jgi:hypothetical protein
MKKKPANTKRLDGKNKLITYTKQMEADVQAFIRDKNIESENELIRQAIGSYIYRDYEDDTLKLQGMKNIQNQITELKDMIDITFKFLNHFHISMLAYHPDIDPTQVDTAYNSAKRRHEKFLISFQESLRREPPFFERLLHRYYSEENKEEKKGETDGQG